MGALRKLLGIWFAGSLLVWSGAVAAVPLDRTMLFYTGVPEYREARWPVDDIQAAVARLDPTESMEAIYRVPWPEHMCGTLEDRVDCLQRAMLRVSGMTGLPYPESAGSAGKTLYHRVHVVDSPQDRRRRPDPQDVRDHMELYVLQDDNDFGEAVMQVEISQQDVLSIRVQNASRLRVGPIPVVSPRQMMFFLDIDPREDAIYIYGVGALSTVRLGLLRSTIRGHLEVRADAMVDWLRRELEESAPDRNPG
ncbi:DUF6675 family protein [Spirochaeta africana]|uniref:Uncharacterized protein n=1 Tax=Spirochaeta africana (strain ATCC 700263 / DSM 8902 / Z-7692) TaxID=889378 RepID=H9UKI5_SPIAZ|nr:DUF6675 family protein [Spirochaeta africana]AFG38028.1 hypothetical protein Spiaf_1977 [Spirochaeta africana DSM 8902]